MATLNQASSARAQFADELAKDGAHTIGVEKGEPFGQSGWVVVAYVDPGADLGRGDALTAQIKGKAVNVPLVVAPAARFEPE